LAGVLKLIPEPTALDLLAVLSSTLFALEFPEFTESELN
jgi:hypothetical protein